MVKLNLALNLDIDRYFTYFSFHFLLALFSSFILYIVEKKTKNKNIVANDYFKNKNHNETFLHPTNNHYIRKIYNKSIQYNNKQYLKWIWQSHWCCPCNKSRCGRSRSHQGIKSISASRRVRTGQAIIPGEKVLLQKERN